MASIVAAWPMAPLGEVLTKSDTWIDIDPGCEYAQVTVRLWGKGVALRGRVQGAEIAASRQLRVSPDQFILSRIDARNGAFGLVPADLNGAVVSNDFPVFDINASRLDPSFLQWMSRTHDFVELCQRASEGTTNRVRLKEDSFLATEIPLPPLDEQRRIVAHIEALAARIEQARGLRREALAEAEALFDASLDAEFDRIHALGWPMITVAEMEELITSGPRNFSSRYTSQGYRFYRAQDITRDSQIATDGAVYVDIPQTMSTRAMVRSGDILVVITGATIGRSAVLSPQHPQGLVSQHVGLVRVNGAKVNPYFLHYCILAPIWAGGQINEAKYGQGKPGLNLTNLRSLRFPLPSIKIQQCTVEHLDEVKANIERLKQRQVEAGRELGALLPSILDKAFRGEL